MKINWLFPLLLLCLAFISAGDSAPKIGNMIAVVDNYFADPTEVTNEAYRAFLADSDNYRRGSAYYPDTSVWAAFLTDGPISPNPLEQLYFRHPAYDEYPVVGITHAQAEAFCRWRQDLWERSSPGRRLAATHRVQFRLPSKDEWNLIARLDHQVAASKQSAHTMTSALYNLEQGSVDDCRLGPLPVDALQEGALGFHHLWGNVAEMVQEEGIAKGGYWDQSLGDARSSNLTYEGATYWLGFRCVCTVEAR